MASEDLRTGLDILHAALLDCGESTSLMGDYADDAKRAVREIYWATMAKERWSWALSPTPGIITTLPKQAATVLSISAATPAIVTLSVSIATSQAGSKFFMDSTQSVYRVAAHTGGTASLTLDAKYVETETAGPAVLYQDEYELPSNVLKVWDPIWPRGWQYDPIMLWDKPTFEQRFGRGSWGLGFGRLEAACEINPSAYEVASLGIRRRIRLAPWTEDAVNLEFDYAAFHDLDFTGTGDADTPRIPREHRRAIGYGAAARIWTLKDDLQKATVFATLYGGVVNDMVTQYLPQQRGALHVQMKHSAALGCN